VASRFWFWRRIPVIFDMQGSLVGELEEHAYFRRVPFLKSGFAAIEWMIDRMPQAITCSSPSSLQIARDRFRVPPERLHLVPEGTDVEPPDPAAGRDMAARLGIPAGRKVVVYTGALLPVKGLNTLLEVMRHSVARNLPVHFLLVGYPVDAAEAFIREHALSDHVTLTGRVAFDDIGPLLAAGDIAIEPKDAPSGEASGKLVNYMAAALPIVAFETPNNLKLLGETGCYASDGPESMVDRIDELIRKPDAGRSIGEAGRDRAKTNFSWDSSARTLYAIYAAALADRTGTT
jgi:glycosyltransferase involved in cell wall biosynthesis